MSDFLTNIFNKRDKPISESSKNLYIRNLEKLNENKPILNLKFLQDIKNILNQIQKYKPTTQRSFIISICTVLKNNDIKLYDSYFEILTKMNGDLKVNVEKTDKQKLNWIEKPEIDKIYQDIKMESSKKSGGVKSNFDNVLNFLILSLYTLQAPRRNIDYTLMKVSSDMSDVNFNYLDIKNMMFIFNNYKTQSTYKKIELKIVPELFEIIIKYLKLHPQFKKLKNKHYDFHFLVNSDQSPIVKSQQMTLILNKIFNKKIGSSMLRNIYLTNKYSDMMSEMKQDVEQMGTSVDTALNNYIKKD